MTKYKMFPQDPYEVFQKVAKNGSAMLYNRATGGTVLGSEFVGTAPEVRRGYALGADQVYSADLQRQLNRASYSDAVQGMIDAGLNPALMYGQSASPQTASVPQSQTQTTADSIAAFAPILTALQGVADTTMNAIALKHQIPNVDADTGNKNANTAKVKLESIGLEISNDIARSTAEFVKREAENKATLSDLLVEAQALANGLAEMDLTYAQDTLFDREDIVAFQADTAYYTAIMSQIEAQYKEDFMQLEKQLREAAVKNERKRYDEICANIKLIYKKAVTEEKTQELLSQQKLTEEQKTRYTQFQADNYEDDQFLKWVCALANFNSSITGAYATSAQLAGAGFSSAGKAVLAEFAGMDVNATNTFKDRWKGKYSSHSGKERKKGEYNEPSEWRKILLGD